ncbi:hypothetical protein QJ850_gp657 [Acanthamoeba polyphaga mimivirus]|uniref:Uncharacterized protein n=1 Tax=Acanthamoeba polyphaga mimivirus Kroon TaxID=3069720 RepID=A0A0G2Y8D2_9VIRU|nr:hypothetical protein QJ850_gp657 [Acanthamoeba polyphaga mimivirus]AKI80042.1 hypothetical protein [Acanthamoeba polyphaga mimivirus Kroon]
MISNNTITIILIIAIVAIVFYIYFQRNKSRKDSHKNPGNYQNFDTLNNDSDAKIMKKSVKKSTKKLLKKSNQNNQKKKVRFDKTVKYNIYKQQSPEISSHNSPFDVDTILNSIYSDQSDISEDSNCSEISELSETSNHSELSDTNNNLCCNIIPSNLEDDTNNYWDSSFGLPLATDEEKNKFAKQIKKNHKNYEKALGNFTKHKTDDNIIIKTDTTIEMFKSPYTSDEDETELQRKPRTVKDIYDNKVAGPKAKPKKIKYKTANMVMYENENEMNGGFIKGTNIHGFDGNAGFKSADICDEF